MADVFRHGVLLLLRRFADLGKTQMFCCRILYAFAPDQSPVLLTAFFERGGKRKTSYEPYIPVAQRRMKEEMEAHGYV